MGLQTQYVAHRPDASGHIPYDDADHQVWSTLLERQRRLLSDRAHPDWMAGLDRLELPEDRIPQCGEVSQVLRDYTGWQVVPVPALIPFTRFYELLAARQFPAASFIRKWEELDYVKEPDIFHEILGHAPLLTDLRFATFTEAFGKAGLSADPKDHALLARLYWFTVEFGLAQTPQGWRSYGAGINSSPGELVYALESELPQRLRFDPLETLRTPYRIDVFQRIYFCIDSFDELFDLAHMDLLGLVSRARSLGMHDPSYPSEDEIAC